MINKADIVARIRNLPTMPGAVVRLFALAKDESSNAGDFEQVIRPDPAMTANLLRLANSAYFGCRRQVTSVRQAITLLGVERVFEIASGAFFARTMPARLPGYDVPADAFWTHCIAVAALSERLAKELGFEAPSLTFTAGLLHDAGKLVIGSFLLEESERFVSSLRVEDATLVEVERRLLGTDHAEVGALVAESWDLPPAIGWAAQWHHLPGGIPEGVDRMLVDLVHAADCLAHSLGFGADVGELSRRVDPLVTERLGIKARRLERVASELIDQIGEMGKIFGQPPGART
ncbi:MAG: HDOD domain-containing protein [Deltaproteobacteria bacterium]|nr:HDOD domain-containing protein [Deltaproteobacteria bacterium]